MNFPTIVSHLSRGPVRKTVNNNGSLRRRRLFYSKLDYWMQSTTVFFAVRLLERGQIEARDGEKAECTAGT